jgi:hypothetical protein
MFRALLAHPQKVLHKRHLVHCVGVMSVGCTVLIYCDAGQQNIHLMYVVPYILVTYMFNLGPTRCTLYSLFLSSLPLHVSDAICTHHQKHNCSVQ